MEKLLQDKVAIITGSGRGIGRAAAELFAKHGARVIVSDLDAAPAAETVLAIQSAGGQAASVPGDVMDSEFPARIVNAAIEKFGGIDILVNNAGYTLDAVIHRMSDEQWDKMLAVHMTAPFRIIRAAASYLRETAKKEKELSGQARARKIVNVSSISGTRGNAGQANYSAAKTGVIGLTKTIAKEWGQFNVQANVVAFGYITTRLTQPKIKGSSSATGIPQEQLDELMRAIPLSRSGTVEEAAGAILFFASPLSNYVSGQVLEVAGGL